jgi:glycosyltransferase involved in cell wall biosynthesis
MPTRIPTSTASPTTRFPSISDRAAALGRAAGGTLRLVANAHRSPRSRRRPLVSVVIPTYNWSSVLGHAVRSALGQSYPPFEVIVVGDACTDDSEAVVEAIGDPRIRWDNLPQNSGSQSTPNNRGIELARGEYIAYLGHDDLWHRDHLAHLVAAVERGPGSLAIATVISIGPPGSNVRILKGTIPTTPSAALHRRDAVERTGGWRDFRTIVQTPDTEFFDRLAKIEGLVHSNALTVWKFNSAMRRNSYVTRRDDEQIDYEHRLETDPLVVERELARWLWIRLRRPEQRLPAYDPEPEEVPPGWYVRQFRKIRGLPEEPEVPVPGTATKV